MSASQSLTNCRVLVIDDHNNIRVTLRMTLEQEGANVDEADTVAKAKELLTRSLPITKESFPYDLILLDIRLPDGNGLDVLKMLSEASLSSRTIMISGEGTVQEAFQATQMGAFDYIEKPFHPERIIVSSQRCVDFNDLRSKAFRGQEILGNHKAIQEVNAVIKRVAPTSGRVLIIGETGTGKELVARSIHRQSERAKKPLVKVNCAAIPSSLIESELFGHEKGAFTGAIKARRGLFEQADGGTLFLDEIGELGIDVQAKLLRVLETGEVSRVGSEKLIKVDVRVIAATHRDIPEMIEHNEFREDLYYRLNVVTIHVPPLRERVEDIPFLAKTFLEQSCEEHSIGKRSFSNQALNQLQTYHWPGNIRELKNIIERVAILSQGTTIEEIEDLKQKLAKQAETTSTPSDFKDPEGRFLFSSNIQSWQQFHRDVDHAYIRYILQQAKGNVSEAARILCLERAYLHRLMKKLGIQRDIVIE